MTTKNKNTDQGELEQSGYKESGEQLNFRKYIYY
jgi:hypothetical protein